jgi:hypothetical protein
VNHAPLVSVVESGSDGRDDVQGGFGRQVTLAGDMGLERLAFQQLHHEEALAHVEDGDDAGVVELAGGLRFAPEAAQNLLLLRLGELLEVQALDRDFPVDDGIPRPVHSAHGAPPELGENLIASETSRSHGKPGFPPQPTGIVTPTPAG